jgi:hypothetical protein
VFIPFKTVCVLLGIATLLSAFLGCGGHSQAETAKEDVKGKQLNDAGAQRMIQEQSGKAPQTGNNGSRCGCHFTSGGEPWHQR